MSSIIDFLRQRLSAGEWSIGQVLVSPGISLRHVADADRSDLESFTQPEEAREIAKYDAQGKYRPLKSAPNLRQGWVLNLRTTEELLLALDFFYPAALGNWIACERGELTGVKLRDTLARQSGMYRVTQLITDEQAEKLIRNICVEGCLRDRLWTVNSAIKNLKSRSENPPVFCVEACNLLVAACRPVAKGNLPKAEEKS